jgi:hypothetical protein
MKIVYLPLLMFLAFGAQANIIYNVYWDTSDPSFGNVPPGPLSLGFEFADGSGTGDGNNSVTLSKFNFGGGGASGSAFLSGSVAGDFASSITFTDAAPTNIFIQGFTAGSSLKFTIDMTTNVDSGGGPDEFILSVLDSTLSPIPTTASSPLFPLLVFDINSANPSVQTFNVDTSQPPAAGGGIFFTAPLLTPQAPSAVPEPASAALSITAFVSIAVYIRIASRRRCNRTMAFRSHYSTRAVE